MKKRIGVAVIFLLAMFAVACGKEEFKVKNHLQDTVATVNDKTLKLQDVAYYIVKIERTVEKQAMIYDSKNPARYWEVHVDGVFIKLQAKEGAVQSAIRDELFNQLAASEGISLTEEEKSLAKKQATDEYNSLSAYQRAEGGLTQDSVVNAITKAVLAEKYKKNKMVKQGCKAEELDTNGALYQSISAQHKIKINNSVWDEVDMGKVSIERNSAS